MEKKQKNVIVYCRADLHENTSEILNIMHKENEVLTFCKSEGLNVVKKFTDFTTTMNKSQPELQNMKDFAMQSENRIHLLVCFELAQIARTFEKVLDEIIDFNQMGINVTSVQQLINYKNNTNER